MLIYRLSYHEGGPVAVFFPGMASPGREEFTEDPEVRGERDRIALPVPVHQTNLLIPGVPPSWGYVTDRSGLVGLRQVPGSPACEKPSLPERSGPRQSTVKFMAAATFTPCLRRRIPGLQSQCLAVHVANYSNLLFGRWFSGASTGHGAIHG